MGKIITDGGRKAIKEIARISQLARALTLMPTPEDFVMMLVSDLRRVAGTVNRVSTRINEILDKYSSIPTEFLLKGFDEVLDKLDDVSDYTNFAINETMSMVSDTVTSAREITRAAGDTASIVTSTVMQVGGAITYGPAAIYDAATNYSRVNVTEDVVRDVLDGKISVSEMKEQMEMRTETSWSNDLNNYRDALGRASAVAINGNNEYYGIDEAMGKAVDGIDKATNAIDNAKNAATEWVDGENGIGGIKDKVEKAKATVEEKIAEVKLIVDNLTKNFDEGFGWAVPKNMAEEAFTAISNTANEVELKDYNKPIYGVDGQIVDYEKKDSELLNAVGEVSGEIANFIKNFNIGKVVTAIGGMTVAAGAATLAMDLLPSIDIDKMLNEIMTGVDSPRVDKMTELYYNKYNDDGIGLLKVPDVPWQLSEDDLVSFKFNDDKYKKFQEKYENERNKDKVNERKLSRYKNKADRLKEKLDKKQSLIQRVNAARKTENGMAIGMAQVNEKLLAGESTNQDTWDQIKKLRKENKRLMKTEENDSALKDLRKLRRNVIKAKQIEKYKGFLNTELKYLENEFRNLGRNIKWEWDSMMQQYKTAIKEIANFFKNEGSGGFEAIDKCCDRINDDGDQIVELCKSIAVELTSAAAMVPTPYAIGTCIDMPVHKILAFFKDIKIIITFLKNLIRLGIDIISQLTILAKIIACGLKDIADMLKQLKELLGIDTIMNLIDCLVALFKPKMADAKLLLENSLSPVYYKETDEYEQKLEALNNLLTDNYKTGGYIEEFKYSNDKYYDGKNVIYGGDKKIEEDEIEEVIEALEQKGEREIVAYRSPILNDAGDDFAGWIFFHAYAYDSMDESWGVEKMIKKNRLISVASKKNALRHGKLVGGVARLKKSMDFGYTDSSNKFHRNTVSGFDAYYWYTKWTNDVTDAVPDMSNVEYVTDENGNIVTKAINDNVVNTVQTTQNGSLVELSDGTRVFVEGKIVKSGDFINVNGKKCRVN